ncbi:MAG: hypothetical protein JOZ41_00965, partial [Chloroflexi bacterium]|nr:hypothetical protein [Chloroflexota bacterium]
MADKARPADAPDMEACRPGDAQSTTLTPWDRALLSRYVVNPAAEDQIEVESVPILRGEAARGGTRPPAVDGTQWTKCPACGAFIYRKRLERSLNVCPECSHHFRLRVEDRLTQLLDEGSFIELGEDIAPVDVLRFADSKPYPARLEEARRATGRREGGVYGMATISGHPVVVAALDFGFIGGSLGGAEGEAI